MHTVVWTHFQVCRNMSISTHSHFKVQYVRARGTVAKNQEGREWKTDWKWKDSKEIEWRGSGLKKRRKINILLWIEYTYRGSHIYIHIGDTLYPRIPFFLFPFFILSSLSASVHFLFFCSITKTQKPFLPPLFLYTFLVLFLLSESSLWISY